MPCCGGVAVNSDAGLATGTATTGGVQLWPAADTDDAAALVLGVNRTGVAAMPPLALAPAAGGAALGDTASCGDDCPVIANGSTARGVATDGNVPLALTAGDPAPVAPFFWVAAITTRREENWRRLGFLNPPFMGDPTGDADSGGAPPPPIPFVELDRKLRRDRPETPTPGNGDEHTLPPPVESRSLKSRSWGLLLSSTRRLSSNHCAPF